MVVDKTKNKQVLVTIPNELFEKVENFRYTQKIPNRNEAIRVLLQEALKDK